MGVDSEHAFWHWDGDMSSLGTGDLINGAVILLSLRGIEHSSKLWLSSMLHTDMVRLVDMGTVRFSKCLTKGKPPQCLLHLDSSLHRGTHSSSAAETSCIAPWLSILAGVCCTGRLLESVELHMFQAGDLWHVFDKIWMIWLTKECSAGTYAASPATTCTSCPMGSYGEQLVFRRFDWDEDGWWMGAILVRMDILKGDWEKPSNKWHRQCIFVWILKNYAWMKSIGAEFALERSNCILIWSLDFEMFGAYFELVLSQAGYIWKVIARATNCITAEKTDK